MLHRLSSVHSEPPITYTMPVNVLLPKACAHSKPESAVYRCVVASSGCPDRQAYSVGFGTEIHTQHAFHDNNQWKSIITSGSSL